MNFKNSCQKYAIYECKQSLLNQSMRIVKNLLMLDIAKWYHERNNDN